MLCMVCLSMDKIALVLFGSFYPLHTTHISLLETAQKYYEEKGYEVCEMLVCPTHFTSLYNKFNGITQSDDNREQTIIEKLQMYPTIKADFTLIRSAVNIGVSTHMKYLLEFYKNNNIQLIQICGVDSKINFAKGNKNVIVVNNNIDIPEQNKPIVKSCKTITQYPILLRTCSSIERFINNEVYPTHTIKEFDLSWLQDSGITLGNGVQGIIRLMFLGTLEVAVKLYSLNNDNEKRLFETECHIMSSFDNNTSFLHVYHSDSIYITDDVSIGYIITNVAIPLNKIIPVEHSYKNGNIDKNILIQNEILEYFLTKVKVFNVEYNQTSVCKLEKVLMSLYKSNSVNFKTAICDGLLKCVNDLKNHGIIHRDIHYDNILLTCVDNNVVPILIDFGVAKRMKSCEEMLRGSLRYYPMEAINKKNVYKYEHDLYMLTFVLYELIELHEIYPECEGNTKEIIKLRKRHVYPEWSNTNINLYDKTIRMICNVWYIQK
jgi:serine/threonine protein kinase